MLDIVEKNCRDWNSIYLLVNILKKYYTAMIIVALYLKKVILSIAFHASLKLLVFLICL